ncbi:serine/threonine protein kinase [Polytolypa hystricis UAMH7299]|uniref:Serine/threonine protein kinase n=1 Tax=Polytolypa hystricis (strain UAMH7299) TaxID=1447883 RepID=A0A2B7XV19_POLH7|nr:serine/threonine protein kinase [Polytolypa hystricis UAMH7299]
MLGFHREEGLYLEHIPGGSLHHYIEGHAMEEVSLNLKFRWATEAAEALQLLHFHRLIHCDMKPQNLLLGTDLHLKVIDFSGSTWEGNRSYASEPTRYHLPRDYSQTPSRRDDIFALGSTFYEIFTGSPPYGDIASDEVAQRYEAHMFPQDVNMLACGNIILGCWLSHFDSTQEEVYESLKLVEHSAVGAQEVKGSVVAPDGSWKDAQR